MSNKSKLKTIQNYRANPIALPDHLGIHLETVGDGTLTASLIIRTHHLNQAHTACHAATIVALADSACGWGCVAHLPEDAVRFTTLELNCNLMRAVTQGLLTCDATLLHGGRVTQIWEAIVKDETNRRVAAFRCSELIVY